MMVDDRPSEKMTFVQCSDCALIYLNPRIPADQIHAYYPEYYLSYLGPKDWGKYAWLAQIGAAQELRKRLNRVRKLVKSPAPRVLDLGCGKPEFLLALQQKWHWQGTGIDFDDSSWQDERYQALDLHIGDPAALDYGAMGKFDLITMWHYLEHDYAPGKTLEKLTAAAHDKTRLVIEVPNYQSWTRRWQGVYWEGFHTPRHTGVYTSATLKNMLETHGWVVERQFSYGSLDPFALWWMGERERKKLPWNKSMEDEFPGFMLKKIISAPLFALQGLISLGVQTVVARTA